ncbi:MAG: pyrroline-5-carboxylate reductase [Alphaproteobacteria bacterium]|nr:pyrroline-5-carboxylate reductase [Alphaproteobacteria bacterium]
MAGAMLEGWIAAGVDPSQISVVRPSGRPVAAGVRVLTALPEDEVPALAMLGTKPQKLDEVAPALARALDPHTILVSILAGTEQATLRALFPTCETIVRAMPNTPVKLRKGAVGLFSDSQDREALAKVESLMAALGTVEWIQEERLFDAVTALSGSGPAFLFRFIDALAAAGEGLGLPRGQAERLALATVEGAAALAATAGESPGALADRVASPGGSTRKGLDVLDGEERLIALLRDTLEAALRRNREMADEARRQ